MVKPIAVPKYPLVILTPQTQHHPSVETLNLLGKLTRAILKSEETYSVTFSPVLCPEGRNWLFTFKPYYWEIDGKWVRRDGHRNPYCDAPQGQKQLETLSTTIRTLGLAAAHLADLAPAIRDKVEELLRVFFVDPETRMNPQVLYAQCNPSVTPLRGDMCFVIPCRYLLLVSQSLPLLPLDEDLRGTIRDWFEQHVEWMRTSEQGAAARTNGNNIAIWYHTLIASHLSYLDPAEAAQYALSFFAETQAAYPSPELYFKRELERSRPRHYTLFTLEPTFIIASVTGQPPPPHVLAYLESLMRYAQTQVPPGEIEVDVDNDKRFGIKLRWFEKMLNRWTGRDVDEILDGTAWDGGWNSVSQLSWTFV